MITQLSDRARLLWIGIPSLLIIAVLVGGGLGLLWKVASSLEAPEIEGSVLHWQAAGTYAESEPQGFLERRQLVHGIEQHAFKDRPQATSAGLALHRSLGKVKGKSF